VFFEYAHYASPSLKGRLIYLADTGLALEHTGTDSGERALMNVARWAGLRVEAYKHFHDSGRSFYLAQRKRHSYDWLAPELASEGIEMQVLRGTPQRRLMLCSGTVAEGQALVEGRQKGGD
jgi:hypothetical protein